MTTPVRPLVDRSVGLGSLKGWEVQGKLHFYALKGALVFICICFQDYYF